MHGNISSHKVCVSLNVLKLTFVIGTVRTYVHRRRMAAEFANMASSTCVNCTAYPARLQSVLRDTVCHALAVDVVLSVSTSPAYTGQLRPFPSLQFAASLADAVILSRSLWPDTCTFK